MVGYRTRRFPGFFITDGGFDLDWSVDSPAQVAAVMAARDDQGAAPRRADRGQPAARSTSSSTRQLHDRTLADGLAMLARDGITGKAVTPFLLGHFHSATEGASLAVNVRIILRNAGLAAQIAVAAAARTTP